MSLRPTLLGLLRSTGHTLTRELANAASAPTADVFRELSKLEAEGAVSRKIGVASIANVGWRITASSEATA